MSAGKTPGIDGIEKEYLTRYWRLIGKTIADASGIFVEKEKLNTFMDKGLIKVIQNHRRNTEQLAPHYTSRPDLQIDIRSHCWKNEATITQTHLWLSESLSKHCEHW